MTLRKSRSRKPTLRTERALQREGFPLIAGMDEVGRGALAGPVSVGVVVIDQSVPAAPAGLRDSKLLSAEQREALVPGLRRWATAFGVGHATPAEIDSVGLIEALRRAGRRALEHVNRAGFWPDVVILDGNHNWLSPGSQLDLFEAGPPQAPPLPEVRTLIKADLSCSSVAAASVLAKVTRDDVMQQLSSEHAAYGWALNKGYAAPEHMAALRELGPCDQHRRSWRLPGVLPDADAPRPLTTPSGPDAKCEEALGQDKAMHCSAPAQDVLVDDRP